MCLKIVKYTNELKNEKIKIDKQVFITNLFKSWYIIFVCTIIQKHHPNLRGILDSTLYLN